MSKLQKQLKGGDLRSIGKVEVIIKAIKTQTDFNNLFKGLFATDRLVIMHSADAIEKVTLLHPEYLKQYKKQILKLLKSAEHIELKWHLAQLITRVNLNETEIGIVWDTLTKWALNTKESRIVRVLSFQGLFDLLKQYPELNKDFNDTMLILEKEPIPSIAARIRILKKKMK